MENTRSVIVKTDHKNLTFLTDDVAKHALKMNTGTRLARWNLFLRSSGAVLQYIPGEQNKIADLLSRWSYPDFSRTLRVSYGHLTRSSGWTKAEDIQLKKLIQRYGIGSWKTILETYLLPGKTISQMVKRFTLIIGRQAFSEFSGMMIDPDIVKQVNTRRHGFYRGNVFINSRPTDLEALKTMRKEMSQKLRTHLHHFVDIWPLRKEDISGKYFNVATTEDKQKYYRTLLDAAKELKLRLRCFEMLIQDGRGDADKRLDMWIQLRWILEAVKKNNIRLKRPKPLMMRCHKVTGGEVILVRRTDLDSMRKEWTTFLSNRLSPFSPLSPTKWTKVDKQLLDKIKRETGAIPKFLLRKLVWQNHFVLGHTSKENEVAELRRYEVLEESDIKESVDKVRNACLNCNRRPKMFRRLLHKNLHSLTVNRVLHMDCLKMKQSYLLVIVEDLSRKVELIVANKPDAYTVVQSILWWRARYGLKDNFVLMTDNGSHFTAEIIKEIEKQFRMSHRYSVSYSPWTNGSAEVTNSYVLKYFRVLMSEYQLVEEEWECLVPLVVSYINHTVSPKTGYTPNQVFHGVSHDGRDVLGDMLEDQFPVLTSQGIKHPKNLDKVKSYLQRLGEKFHEVSEKVFDIKDRIREQQNRSMKTRFKIEEVQFAPGDFVLMSVAGVLKGRNKLKLNWIGPYIVKKVEGHTLYLLTDPLGKDVEAHSSRIRFYDGESLEFSEVVKHQFVLNRGKFYLKEVTKVRFRNRKYEIKCKWHGLEEYEDSWEDLESIFETAPDPIIEFLTKSKDKELKTSKERLLKSL